MRASRVSHLPVQLTIPHSKWDFFTADDPTHGAVRYVSRDEAFAANMAFVEDDGTIKIGVESNTTLQDGEKRKS